MSLCRTGSDVVNALSAPLNADCHDDPTGNGNSTVHISWMTLPSLGTRGPVLCVW